VRFWLLEQRSFTREYLRDGDARWLRQFRPSLEVAVASLERGERSVLWQVVPSCAEFTTGSYVVLDARCIVERL
jgi:hypothetical protein